MKFRIKICNKKGFVLTEVGETNKESAYDSLAKMFFEIAQQVNVSGTIDDGLDATLERFTIDAAS